MLPLANLHVSPKTEIYLDFSIKNAGFFFAVEICDFFSRTISIALMYRCWVKFCTEKLENAPRKLLKFNEINTAFSCPMWLLLILEGNLIGADFDHVLGNPL